MGTVYPIVITHLEMDKVPVHSVPHPLGQIAIMRAHKPPVHFYRYLYNTVGADYVWVNRRRLTDEELANDIHHCDVEISVIYFGGCPAGFSELDFRKKGEAELAYFGMLPGFAGRGLGRFFLAETIQTAWTHDIGRLIVQTCTKDHPAALPLYQQMGFSPFAQENAVLEDLND